MANRGHCAITLNGERAELERFRNLAQDGERVFSMDRFVPVPTELPEYSRSQPMEEAALLTHYHGQPNSFQWRMEHWGTGRDAEDSRLEDQGDTLSYRFNTAWTPFSENAIATLAAMFPKLDLRMDFDEPLNGLTGWLEAAEGRVTGSVSQRYTEEETIRMWGEPR